MPKATWLRISTFSLGSRASKKNDPYSDYDFYVKGKKPVPEENWRKFYDSVQEIQTLYKIDLVDFMRASDDFKIVAQKNAQEIKNGKIRSKK